MYAALSTEGEIIYANDQAAVAQETNFYCPTCQQLLTHKMSSTGKGYFSHLTSCQSNQQKRQTQESQTHHTAKILLQNTLTSSGYTVEIEYPFKTIQQIADVYAYHPQLQSSQQVIEFQKVPISSDLIRGRTQSYLQVVDKCTWLIDEAIFKTGYRQVWLQTMVTYSEKLGFHWYALNVHTREWVIKFKMPVIYRPHHIQLAEKRFDLEKAVENTWEQPEKYLNTSVYYPIYRRSRRQSTYFRDLKQIMAQAHYQTTIRDLYSKGILLQTLPSWMVTEGWQIFVCKSPGWQCMAWFYYLIQSFDGASFTKSELEKGVRELLDAGYIILADMALVSHDVVGLLVDSLIKFFKEKSLIENAGCNRWRIQTKVHR